MPHREIVTRRLNARSGSICTEKLPIQSRVAGSIELDTCIHHDDNFVKLTWLDHCHILMLPGFKSVVSLLFQLARGAVIETDAVTRKAFGSRQAVESIIVDPFHLILLINFWLISPDFSLNCNHQASEVGDPAREVYQHCQQR